MNLIPFLTDVLPGLGGQILICILLLPHYSLSRSQLCSLFITSVNAFTWVSRLSSLILDEIVFRICNLQEHIEPLLFIPLYTRSVPLMHLIYAYTFDAYGAPKRKQQFSSWSKIRLRGSLWMYANNALQIWIFHLISSNKGSWRQQIFNIYSPSSCHRHQVGGSGEIENQFDVLALTGADIPVGSHSLLTRLLLKPKATLAQAVGYQDNV